MQYPFPSLRLLARLEPEPAGNSDASSFRKISGAEEWRVLPVATTFDLAGANKPENVAYCNKHESKCNFFRNFAVTETHNSEGLSRIHQRVNPKKKETAETSRKA